MMLFISLLQYVVSFLLGAVISAFLAGAPQRQKWIPRFLLVCISLLAVQLVCFLVFGLAITRKLYPLITHIPLWALLVLILKTPKLQTAVSVLTAYLCCQVPRWIASLGMLLSEEHWLYPVLYIPVSILFVYLFWRYLSAPLGHFLHNSHKNCLQMGMIPALYYLFDYVTTIYTNLLRSGNMAAVQFMPSMLSIAYLLFLMIFHAEHEKQRQLGRERDLLSLQLRQAETSLSAISQIQEQTRQYRHDMRHHFNYLQSLAAENNIPKIQQYLSTAQQDMDALTPVRYCGNETVNMLLTYFASVAKNQQVEYSVSANLPSDISYSETELCSLLSNGLENAIHAASQVPASNRRSVSIHMGTDSKSILIQIENTHTGPILWEDGLPLSQQNGHGLGTRSIRTIARAHGGEALFREQDGIFQLRILLPND